MPSNERQVWMVEQMDVRPDDSVVELGHGHGVAATAICDRLAAGSGRYVGVDRSATMTAAAGRRLAEHLDAGRALLVTGSVADAALDGSFDLVVAIHFPPIERGDPTAELAALVPRLRVGSRLCVGFQPPSPAGVDVVVERLGGLLPAHGFTVDEVRRGTPSGRPAAVVVATWSPADG